MCESPERKTIKLRIVSDGTLAGSRVEDQDGRIVEGVNGVSRVISTKHARLARVSLESAEVPVDVVRGISLGEQEPLPTPEEIDAALAGGSPS